MRWQALETVKVCITAISTKTVPGHFFEKMANAFSLIWINGPIIRFGSGIIVQQFSL